MRTPERPPMSRKAFSIVTTVLLVGAIAYGTYNHLRVQKLESTLAEKEMANEAALTAMTEAGEINSIDQMLVDGDEYSKALEAYQNKYQSEEAIQKEQLKWRMALAEKMLALKQIAKNEALAAKNLDKEDAEASVLANEIQLNQKDSLQFALEKSKMQLKRLRKQLQNKSEGEYLTFKTHKGSKLHYVGHVNNGKANGYGVAILSTGSRYQGYWKDNLRHGEGTFYWSDGEYYVGEYKNDKRHGLGTYYWPNGEKYVGSWENDKRYGLGTFYAKDGSVVAKGTWENDKLISEVKKAHSDKDKNVATR